MYIGSHAQARDKKKLQEMHITHVVAIGDALREQFDKVRKEKGGELDFKYLVLDCMEGGNLLAYFDDVYKFIEKGKKKGYVLIHCPSGDNRAAVVCASYLMKSLKLSVSDAMEIVKECRPTVSMSEGFIDQLHMYWDMLHPKKAEEEPQEPPPPEPTPQATAPVPLPPEDQPAAPPAQSAPTSPVSYKYACQSCRVTLFTDKDLVSHKVGKGQSAFKWSKRDVDFRSELCTSYFISKMDWMGPCSENEGKLACPRCHARVGGYYWSGVQCSCGTWCTPAFQLSKAKIDEKNMIKPLMDSLLYVNEN
uniref:protein-tyrosine-phosphatase n=1 Tax=Arcella intermedia TaxID=1963864 RepID=A0A6B2LB04_9EUKA